MLLNVINRQARLLQAALLLCGLLMMICVSQHPVGALAVASPKRRLIDNYERALSSGKQQHQRYQADIADKSALETNEIASGTPKSTTTTTTTLHDNDDDRLARNSNYETNEQQQPQQRKLIASFSIGDERLRASDGAIGAKPSEQHHEQAECLRGLHALQKQFVEQVIRQRVVDEDHLLMEKWLVDNINDLHRELKQSEMDFEHYVQVTKKLLAGNELERNNYLLKRQLAMQTALPLSFPLQTVPAAATGASGAYHDNNNQRAHDHRHPQAHLTKLLLLGGQ